MNMIRSILGSPPSKLAHNLLTLTDGCEPRFNQLYFLPYVLPFKLNALIYEPRQDKLKIIMTISLFI